MFEKVKTTDERKDPVTHEQESPDFIKENAQQKKLILDISRRYLSGGMDKEKDTKSSSRSESSKRRRELKFVHTSFSASYVRDHEAALTREQPDHTASAMEHDSKEKGPASERPHPHNSYIGVETPFDEDGKPRGNELPLNPDNEHLRGGGHKDTCTCGGCTHKRNKKTYKDETKAFEEEKKRYDDLRKSKDGEGVHHYQWYDSDAYYKDWVKENENRLKARKRELGL